MRTRSLVPKPNTMLIGLGTTLVHKGNKPRAQLAQSLPVVVGKVCEHHIDKSAEFSCQLIATLNKVATHSYSKL